MISYCRVQMVQLHEWHERTLVLLALILFGKALCGTLGEALLEALRWSSVYHSASLSNSICSLSYLSRSHPTYA